MLLEIIDIQKFLYLTDKMFKRERYNGNKYTALSEILFKINIVTLHTKKA